MAISPMTNCHVGYHPVAQNLVESNQSYPSSDTSCQVLVARYRFWIVRLVGGVVQLGPLGTAATDWPIVACPGRL
jgi:hypothetical protein